MALARWILVGGGGAVVVTTTHFDGKHSVGYAAHLPNPTL
jgi:hypothetical protein